MLGEVVRSHTIDKEDRPVQTGAEFGCTHATELLAQGASDLWARMPWGLQYGTAVDFLATQDSEGASFPSKWTSVAAVLCVYGLYRLTISASQSSCES